MQKITKLWVTILFFIFLLTGTIGVAQAVEQTLGQVQISLTTDKTVYNNLESITATIKVENRSKTPLYDIDLIHDPVENYSFSPDSKNIQTIKVLPAGESVVSVMQYINDGAAALALPQTGDNSMLLFWSGLLLSSVVLIAVLANRLHSVRRMLSLALCMILLSSMIPTNLVRAEEQTSDGNEGTVLSFSDSVTLIADVFVDNTEMQISGQVVFHETSLRDNDQDGLFDYVENIVGSDNTKEDTDNDGLTDFQEVTELSTDPTKPDSDGDGILDGEEDFDGDGLQNRFEYENGLNPVLKDTDFDDLTDSEELNIYHTNPQNPDTDGDGASDGLEIAFGTNPLVADRSFVQTVSSEPVDSNHPVSVEVSANIPGKLLGTVTVTPVGFTDNQFVTSNIPGALGTAFELSAGGEINSASVVFRYDTSLGKIGSSFQPRIYYLNEKTNELEELPNQKVVDGQVSADLMHFSYYILLNKVAFDAIWDTEIKPPDYVSNKNGLDIVFVIDSSGSMTNNDSKGLRKLAAKQFVDKLGSRDRAAVVDFDSSAYLYQSFTSDHDLLYAAIDRIDSFGGTNLSKGISLAINQFTSASYTRKDAYKYIVFLTDGDGSYSTSYTTTAKNNGIVIYTIGLGSGVKASTLQRIAQGTNGKYYFASVATDLPAIYEEVSQETIDYTTDSNNDGISDYYTKLIYEGKLVLSNGSYRFVGEDLNYDENGVLSADFDGDGLLNGEELIITKSGSKVYMKMVSNPLIPDSDYDGYDDRIEKRQGSDPLKYSYSKYSVDSLRNNDIFCGYLLADEYDNSWSVQIAVNLVDTLSFNWNPVKNCKQLYMDYFYDYASHSVDSATEANEKEDLIEWVACLSENTKNGIKYLMAGKEYVVDEPIKVLDGLHILRSQLNTVNKRISQAGKLPNQSARLEKLADDLLDIHKKLDDYGFLQKKVSVKVTDFANKYQHLMNKKNFTGLKNSTTISLAASALSTAASIADTWKTYEKLLANEKAYLENLDILSYLAENGSRKMARDACNQIYGILESEYMDFDKQRRDAMLQDAGLGFAEVAVSRIVESNPYTRGVKLAFDLMDLAIGMSHKAETIDYALCYESLTTGLRYLSTLRLRSTSMTYDCSSSEHSVEDRYLLHLAQTRIVAERNFVFYTKNTGLLTMWFSGGYKDAKAFCNGTVEDVRYKADTLGLSISSKLVGVE